MHEAVRTMASPAATWVIVVMATCLALFMALAAMVTDLSVARAQRRERKLGIAPESVGEIDEYRTDTWPRLSEALFDSAGARPPTATGAAWTQAGYTAAGHDFPAEIPAQRQEPAEQPAAARQATAAQYAGGPEAEAPTQPIPAQRAPAGRDRQDTPDMQGAGRHERADDPAGEMPTRPDLLAQDAPGRRTMPTQRTGESDRAERSFAGPAPQDDDDEGEQ